MTDPFALEVHRPVQLDKEQAGLPDLPPYLPREHDAALARMVTAAAQGHSQIAVLVGGSSTGKTRACWEALHLLRDQPGPWRLWHPIDPTRPAAALRDLQGIGPRTVVWLNEAQFYLAPAEAGLGERVAAGLRELLRDPGRAPVLALATVWPEFWHDLTVGDDRHGQARELLAGHDITVPAAFTPAQMSQLARAADARMALAARSAPDGEVTQFLAGAPELLARYRNAPPAARALIDAAMDARRLGMGAGLPQAFLEAAAPGYLTDDQWDALGEDWLEQALAYAAGPCKGAHGPLTRIHPRPYRYARGRSEQPGGMAAAAGPLYRLADYLDQHGRAYRASQIPPAEFWSAAAAHAAAGDQATLGDAAHARGLYRAAAQLHKNAAATGNPDAVFYLSHPPYCLRADPRPAHWAAAYAALDDPGGVASLLDALREAGAHDQTAALLARDPAAHAALDDPGGKGARAWHVSRLLRSLELAGAHDQVAALASRAAAHAPLDNPDDVVFLVDGLRSVGAHDQAAALLARDPATHVSLGDPGGVARLLDRLRKAGAHDQAAALLARDPAAHAAVDDVGGKGARSSGVAKLVSSLELAGAHDQAAALASRAAAHASLDMDGVFSLLTGLQRAGAHDQAAALASRAAAHVSLDAPGGVAFLLEVLEVADAHDQAAALLARDPATHVSLGDPGGVARLLDRLRKAGAHDQAAALLARDPATHVTLENPGRVALLLYTLREVGAHDQAAALLARDPAAHVTLGEPDDVARLLDTLRGACAHDQAAALLARDPAAHVTLETTFRVARLLDTLRRVGAHDQTAALARRLPAAGMFDLFFAEQDRADQFRFGCEADGTPAAPWSWEDLDLRLVPQYGPPAPKPKR